VTYMVTNSKSKPEDGPNYPSPGKGSTQTALS